MNTPPTKEVSCCDCHMKATIDATLFCPPDWDYLSLTGRVRCGSCRRALDEANRSFDQPHRGHMPDFQDTGFAPLAPIDLQPMSDPEPAPTPFRSGGGGDFVGGGAEASFEVAASPPPAPAPAPADPPASSSGGSDSSSASSGD